MIEQKKFDLDKIRLDFPILNREVNGHPLIYLDNAATSQKPQSVIDAMNDFYCQTNANIHRAVHYLAEESTSLYEAVRGKVKNFIQSKSDREIIFVRGATEAINLVAQSYVRPLLQPGDEILISGMEHHANIVPWQIVCEQTGAKLVIIPIDERGELLLSRFEELLSEKTKFVSITHVSNVLGIINPIKTLIEKTHEKGAKILIDGCQALPHLKVNVSQLNCDFYVFSAHKFFGPTGTGVLYGRADLLEKMPPYQTGGDMINEVTFLKTTYADIPYKFEAGTPNISGVIGLGAAIDYIDNIGIDNIIAYEHELGLYLMQKAAEMKDIKVFGQSPAKIPLLSFTIDRTHHNDVGTLLDQLGIAVRTGHHCCMPLMQRFSISGMVRASLSFYNTKKEIDELFAGLERVKRILIDPEEIEETNDTASTSTSVLIEKAALIDDPELKNKVIEALRTIYDPEIPVNIYDLGLIYGIEIDMNKVVHLRMTLTSPACPVAQTFPDQVRGTVSLIEGVNNASVELVWEPPWSRENMSEAAKLELGMF